jgi:hypothetical protein
MDQFAVTGRRIKELPVIERLVSKKVSVSQSLLGPENILLVGEEPPSDALGNDGDFFLNTITFDLYAKIGGTWA